MKWFTLGAVLAICVILPPLFFSGCTPDEAEQNLEKTQELTAKITPYVPTTHTWIPSGISALCALGLSIVKILKERRETQKMKSAIVTKSDQIDKLILSVKAASDNPGNVVTKFMKTDTRTRTPEEKCHLNHFDAVRKNLL